MKEYKINVSTWFCPDCGTENDIDARLCNCGYDILEDEPTLSETGMGIDPEDY